MSRVRRPRARLAGAAVAASCLLSLLAGAAWAQAPLAAGAAPPLREGAHLLERWGHAAIFGLVAIDFLGVPVPATTVMIAAAVAAMHGTLSLPAVVLLSFLGVLTGSQLGYAVGRLGGAWALHHLPISEERLAKVDRAYARWGAWIVVVAPYVDGLRQLNAFTAGMLELPWWRFVLANLAGAALWVGGWVGGTYLLDEHLPGLVAAPRALGPLILALAAAALLALLAYLLRGPGPTAPPGGPPSGTPEGRGQRQGEQQDLKPAGQHPEDEQPFRRVGQAGEGAARPDTRA